MLDVPASFRHEKSGPGGATNAIPGPNLQPPIQEDGLVAPDAHNPIHSDVQSHSENRFTTLAQLPSDHVRKRQITDWYEAGEITRTMASWMCVAFGLEAA